MKKIILIILYAEKPANVRLETWEPRPKWEHFSGTHPRSVESRRYERLYNKLCLYGRTENNQNVRLKVHVS